MIGYQLTFELQVNEHPVWKWEMRSADSRTGTITGTSPSIDVAISYVATLVKSDLDMKARAAKLR